MISCRVAYLCVYVLNKSCPMNKCIVVRLNTEVAPLRLNGSYNPTSHKYELALIIGRCSCHLITIQTVTVIWEADALFRNVGWLFLCWQPNRDYSDKESWILLYLIRLCRVEQCKRTHSCIFDAFHCTIDGILFFMKVTSWQMQTYRCSSGWTRVEYFWRIMGEA